MARPQKKLTKRIVEALQPDPAGRDVIHFDAEIPRYGVRVKPSGVKTYVLQYRNKFGQARRFTIGRVGDLTPAQARDRALILRGEIATGADPSAQRRVDRKAPTVGALCDEYLEAAKGRLKPNSIRTHRAGLVHHVKPLLGSKPIATLTPADIEKFLRDVTEGKTSHKPDGKPIRRGGIVTGGTSAAARLMAVLGSVLQRAVRDGLLASNPVRKLPRIKEQPRRPPPFSFETIERLGDALRVRESEGERFPGLRAIRFLLLSGFRRAEALTLKWEMVDRKARCARLPDTKTGPSVRPLGRGALDFLGSFEPKDASPSDYVFPGNSAAGHFNDLPRVWMRLCKQAGIKGASIHALRHWYASCAAELNISELLIAGLIGHRVRSVTGRYATAPDTALIAAADRVSLRLEQALNGTQAGKVVNLQGRG